MAEPGSVSRRRGSKLSTDSDTLALLGKKQVLKRRFGFPSLLAFAICELITWETVLALFSQGFTNGGPAGLVYGFIIAWLSTLSVYTVIAELASIAPIASGQYYWVYMLAPPKYKKVSSYMVGWLTSLAWIATVATESLFAGTIIQGLINLSHPEYTEQLWQGTLLTWAVIVINVLINTIIPDALPKIELLIMVLHLCGFVGIMVALLTTAEIGSAESVWLTSLNRGGWPTQGLSYCVGFLGNVATFVGADASVHMAEEVSNAAINIPRAITAGMIINGCIGFAMMVTALYCLGPDVDSILDSPTGFPFLQIFYNAVGTRGGAVAMGAIVLILTWACSTGITTTASRMTWSFARDKGTPFSHILSKVDPRTQVPIIAVFAVTGFAMLLTCIYFGSATAFNDVISLTITGFYGSYLIPSALLLYHRVKGNILPYGSVGEDTEDLRPRNSDSPEGAASGKSDDVQRIPAGDADIRQERITWGPWHMPGILGIAINAYACMYMVFVIFWSVWPPQTPVTPDTMNYSIVVTGGVMILSVVWYYIGGKKQYKGPVVDEDVVEVVRRRKSSVVVE
ncbi:amino acid transporter [Aulographum hederae CBS 113979]|uniref:Amino acid transporter n=1 Tax=Aulographum hederae CBS 113979 TaxID=1176131 RepID=A0A6G1GUJ7_9PEZI|nr:amino acid transporter [Aulographum hederae CBS 113979]